MRISQQSNFLKPAFENFMNFKEKYNEFLNSNERTQVDVIEKTIRI